MNTKKITFFRLILPITLIMLVNTMPVKAQQTLPSDFCISPQEKALFDRLNQLIAEYGKPELELSSSLSYVARVHVADLLNNRPDTSFCNLSSWSDKGEWTACCHNPYLPQQDCMWGKPKELTSYPYRGYELVSYFEDTTTVDSVMNLWTPSKEVLDMLLTEGNFKKMRWICMGVGMNSNYVSVWFGQRADNAKAPAICNDPADTVPAAQPAQKATTFYVIYGSYNTTRDAKEALKILTRDGFDKAGLLKRNDLIRVYLNNFESIHEATLFKQNLPNSYREAWIFKD